LGPLSLLTSHIALAQKLPNLLPFPNATGLLKTANSLGEVIDFYDKRFRIELTSQEKEDLVAFLSTLVALQEATSEAHSKAGATLRGRSR
jgi:hypothetical protein